MQLKNKVQYQYVIDIMEMPQQGQRINVKFFCKQMMDWRNFRLTCHNYLLVIMDVM